MDEAPVVRAADGEAGFERLVREHASAVFAMLVRRVGDRDLADDLAQETFVRAWRGLASFRGEASPRAWLFAIAANVARDHARRSRRRPRAVEAISEEMESPGSDPAAHAEARDALARLESALRTLPETHREMFLLRERDGLSYREIATVMACPVGSVMSGLARARERLIKAVEA